MNLIVKRSAKRKTISVAVYPDQRVVVSAPMRLPEVRITMFVNEKKPWIETKLKWFATLPPPVEKRTYSSPLARRAAARAYQEQALAKLKERITHYAPLLKVSPRNVAIRNYKSRWGACKSNGDLVFNWRLILASDLVFDYVVVHELSHLKEFNHSPAFWRTVESVFPRYKEAKKELRLNSFAGNLEF